LVSSFNRYQNITSAKPVKLVVIDSIAAIFRTEYTKEQSIERARMMTYHAHELQKISDEFKIAIIVVNQVRDNFFDFSPSVSFMSSNKFVVPTLGLSWANCVNMRIMFEKSKRTIAINDYFPERPTKKQKSEQDTVTLRKLSIVWAPHLPNSSTYFVILSEGVRGIEED